MKTNILKFTAFLLILAGFFSACEHKEPESKISGLTFTPCKQTQQTKAKSNATSDGVSVEFTNQGVQITYNHFEVTCDFSTVDVTYTFVNGFLNITQQGSPSRADCVCYSDVSYTINGISQSDVNVIFINGEQVYCHNDNEPDENYPIEIPFEEYSFSPYCWLELGNIDIDSVTIINSEQELANYVTCVDGTYSEIDFSQYTLLFAYGDTPLSVISLEKQLQQISISEYSLYVNVKLGTIMPMYGWMISIKVPKLSQNAVVTLNVDLHH